VRRRQLVSALLFAVVLAGVGTVGVRAEPVPVRYTEGLVHGFLLLRTLDGQIVADGDLYQIPRGDRVNAQIVFRFRDGSIHDETAVYTQRREFRLVSYRLSQKGASFPRTLDMSIDASTGQVQVRYSDDEGDQKRESEQLELPPDLANGLVSTLLKNVRPEALPRSLSYVAATPKPRLVKLELATAPQARFTTGRRGRLATHYVVKVEIGGLAGLVAPIVGKQPPDSHVWILRGAAPAFVRAEQTLFLGGPVYRIELTSPSWPPPKEP
jgi:hypothetical protein